MRISICDGDYVDTSKMSDEEIQVFTDLVTRNGLILTTTHHPPYTLSGQYNKKSRISQYQCNEYNTVLFSHGPQIL